MVQNNTNKLMGLLILILLALIYFLWQQNSALQAQLEADLKSPEITVKNEVKAAEARPVYKPPVRKTSAPTQAKKSGGNNQELYQLQKMLGDLMKLKEGLE